MGAQSSAAIMAGAARHAEALAFESIWITDHLAIPPDDAEGSGGRYTDPLTTLAWLAATTRTIGLGVGVLVLPYRPALPTAKAIATVQELSGERLLLGVAVGWMDSEFRALGVARNERGQRADDVLAFLQACFANDVVERHGQPFLFKPRPHPPPIYVGGRPPHALRRALRFGAGWMPMVREPAALARDLATFERMAEAAGGSAGPVTAMSHLPVEDPGRARDLMAAYQDLGIERLVCAQRYETLSEYCKGLDRLAALRDG
jgi:probable F420-dependent oxidoreductase